MVILLKLSEKKFNAMIGHCLCGIADKVAFSDTRNPAIGQGPFGSLEF
jgi:hypothetical protein